MRWTKFSEMRPAKDGQIILRTEHRSIVHPPVADWSFSYSSDTLWMGGRYALDQNYYEWLNQSHNVFEGYSIEDIAALKNKIKQLEEALNKVAVQK